MKKKSALSGGPTEVTDSLDRRWPVEDAVRAMDQKLLRRLDLDFSPGVAQTSFSTYCKKHFIAHGEHFDPGATPQLKVRKLGHVAPSVKAIAPTFDPDAVAATFEANMKLISHGMESMAANMQQLDVGTLREITHAMKAVLNGYKDIERLELQYMGASEFETLLEEEMDCNGVRSALSLGKYFLECGHLTEAKQLAVAAWLSECAQDEFERILSKISDWYGVHMEVKVIPSGLDWAQAGIHLEDDRRWIPLTRAPYDFNVIIGMLLGVLAGKGLSAKVVANEFNPLLFPLDTVGISKGVVAMAVNKLKAKAKTE